MQPTIVGIYLAAGRSRRMGCAKLGLPLDLAGEGPLLGQRLGGLALERLKESSIKPIIAVTREEDSLEWLQGEVAEYRGDMSQEQEEGHSRLPHERLLKVTCMDSWKGMAHSIRYGMAAALRYKPEAVVIVLADQPLITSELLERLVEAYRNEAEPPDYVSSGDRGKAKPPILFGRRMFEDLLALEGDQY